MSDAYSEGALIREEVLIRGFTVIRDPILVLTRGQYL